MLYRTSLKTSWLLALPLVVVAVGCADESPFQRNAGTDPNATGKQAQADIARGDVRPKEITKVAPRASVVLDKNCPDIVQPYKLTDNLMSLGLFGAKAAAADFGKQIGALFTPGKAPVNTAVGSGISASTKLAAKQLNWLPMRAEVAFGQRSHKQETAILDRDSKLGNKYYPIADKMLEEVLAGVGQPHDYAFKLFILKNSTRNAIARPGGFLYLDQGLLDNPAQRPKAYFALAHEVAHVLQRHETKELQSTVVDSISLKDDLFKTISSAKSDPNAILAHLKVEKNRFTQHHIDQELQADSCAVRLLSRALPDQKALATSLNAFLNDLSKPERKPPLPPPQSDEEKLTRSLHEIVDTPVKRHPNNEERQQNLRSIYAEIAPGAPLKRP